jgi:hypothetical protein
MAPRDVWDLNPVFMPHFWWSYMDVLRMIGFIDDPDEEGEMVLYLEGEDEEVPDLEIIALDEWTDETEF